MYPRVPCPLWGALVITLVSGRPGAAAAQSADSLLDQLDRLAREHSSEVIMHRTRTLAASRRIASASAMPAPSLRAEIENVPDWVRVDEAQQMVLGVDALIARGQRGDAARQAASASHEVLLAGEGLVVGRAIAHARRDVVGMLATRAGAIRLASEDSVLASAEDALRVRFEVGEARYVDVLRLRTARLQVATDRSALLAASDVRRLTVLAMFPDPAIREEAGRLLDSISLVAPSSIAGSALVGQTPVAAPDTTLTVALRQAFEVRADAERDLALANRGTQVSGFAGLQRFQDQAGAFVVGPSIGLSVELPFLTARSNHAIADAADARRAAALSLLETRLVTLGASQDIARRRHALSMERLAAIDAVLLAGARDEREAALASYRTGELSLVEFLDFERALARSDLARLEAVIAAADALAEFIQLPADQLLDLLATSGESQ